MRRSTVRFRGFRTLLRLAPILVLPLVFCGCEDEDTDTDISATRFNVDRHLKNYSDTDEYTWDTTLTQPVLTLRIDDFLEGDTTLRVNDANGKAVLTATLNTANNTYFVGGDDLVFQRRTAAGAPGKWTVILGYGDFTGEYELTIE